MFLNYCKTVFYYYYQGFTDAAAEYLLPLNGKVSRLFSNVWATRTNMISLFQFTDMMPFFFVPARVITDYVRRTWDKCECDPQMTCKYPPFVWVCVWLSVFGFVLFFCLQKRLLIKAWPDTSLCFPAAGKCQRPCRHGYTVTSPPVGGVRRFSATCES